jgi:hypothetical protein
MKSKYGLLPYYLKLYTIFRSLFIFIEHKKYINISHMTPSVFFLSLIVTLSIVRLYCLRNIRLYLFYIFIGFSFIVEGVSFLYYRNLVYFGKTRVIFELSLSLFTITIMVYLYPYYLLNNKSEDKQL